MARFCDGLMKRLSGQAMLKMWPITVNIDKIFPHGIILWVDLYQASNREIAVLDSAWTGPRNGRHVYSQFLSRFILHYGHSNLHRMGSQQSLRQNSFAAVGTTTEGQQNSISITPTTTSPAFRDVADLRGLTEFAKNIEEASCLIHFSSPIPE
jgi:hypothetical protein